MTTKGKGMSKNMTKLFEMFSTAAKTLCLTGALVIGLSAFAESTPDYLSFTARDGSASLSLEKVGDPGEPSLEYATDPRAVSWSSWSDGGVTLEKDVTLYLRRASGTATNVFCASAQKYYTFKMEPAAAGVTVQGAGNIMSLVDQSCAATELGEFAFYGLFQNCTNLTTAPMLAATNLAKNCYGAMFTNCTSLVRMAAAFTAFSIQYTPSWMLGVGTEGVFIAPLTSVPRPSTAYSVPDTWKCAKPSTVVIDPAGLANIESFVVSNSTMQIIPSVVEDKYVYVFAGKQEQAVVQLVPQVDCMVIGDNPFILSNTELVEGAVTNITDKLVAQPICWTIGAKTYPSLSWALRAVTNGVTLTGYDYLSSGVVTNDCNFAISNDDVTVDFAGLKPVGEEPQTFDVIAAINVTIKNGTYEGQVRLDAAGLVLDNATITNALPIAVTNACSLKLDDTNQLVAEGAKICLFGTDATLYCETDLELNNYIVAYSDPDAKYPNKVYKPADNLYAVAPVGSEWNPWCVGGGDGTVEDVQAYTNGTGGLVITGQNDGKMKDFTDDPAPWDAVKDAISVVTVDATVGRVGAAAFVNLNDETEVIFLDSNAAVNPKAFAAPFNEKVYAEMLTDPATDCRVRPGAWTNAMGGVYGTLKAAFDANESVVYPSYEVTPIWKSWTEGGVRFTINNYEAGDYRVPTVVNFANMAEGDITDVEFVTATNLPSDEIKGALADAITNALPKAALKPQFNFHYDYVNFDVLTNKAAAADVEFAKMVTFYVPWQYTTGSAFRVARHHGGEAALIPYVAPSAFDGSDLDECFTYDPTTGRLAIRAKKFSSFAIGSYDGSVAKIADVTYPSISSAFASILDGNPTIEVLCDVSDPCDMQAPEDASVILDFAGFSNEVDTVVIGALKGALTVSNGVINANTIATTADFTNKVYFRALDLCSTDLNIANGSVRICNGVKSAKAEEFSAAVGNLQIVWDGEPASKFAYNQKKFLSPQDGTKGSPVFAYSDDDDKDIYAYKVIPLGEVDFRLVKADGTWTEDYFINVYEVLKAADTNDYLVMYKDRSADILLGDGEPGYGDTNDVNAISKNIRFSTATNEPPTQFTGEIHAIRHDETFYTEKAYDELMGTDTYVLTKRGAPSRRLTLEIVGRGRVKVEGEPSYHENPGDQTWIDYSELTTNTWYTLTAEPVADGEHLFWRWEDASTNRLDYWTNEVGTVFCAYDDEIHFRMGEEDTKLRIVFLPKDDDRVQPHDVRIVINPSDASATEYGLNPPADAANETKLDGKLVGKVDSVYLFSAIKGGEHTVETAPNEANSWRFLNWVTNNVIVENSAVRFDNYLVEPTCTNITARFIPSDHVFEVTAAATNVFDWSFHGLEYNFAGWEADHTRLEFCTNNLTWATNYPSYVHAGDYEIKARVLWNLEKSVDELTEADMADLRSGRRVIIPCPLTNDTIVASVSAYAFDGSKPEIDLTFTPNGYHLVKGTDFTVEYDAEGGLGHAKVTGTGDFCESLTLDYNILREITVDGVTYYLQQTGDVYQAAIALVNGKTGDPAGVYHVPAQVTAPDDGKTYTVVDIVPGAFTNSPDIVKLVIPQKVNLWGNIIWGLEKLEEIDFAGYGPEDSPYYFYKLGTEFNGARVLVKSNMNTAPGEIHWDTDTVTLLGTVVAGDSFDVIGKVTKIAPTAFAGNPYLLEINLHNGVTEIGGGLCQYLDMNRVVFTLPGAPSDYLEKYFRSEFRMDNPEEHAFLPTPDGTKWTTFNWSVAEARIESKGYYKFKEALQAARNGQTVVALTNLFDREIQQMFEAKDEGEGIVKRIILDATDCFVSNLTIDAGAEVGIVGGTFDRFEPFNSLLVRPSSLHANPVMAKWYDADGTAWWTVIDQADTIKRTTSGGDAIWYRDLKSAAQDAKADDTIEVIRATGDAEDFTISADVTFVYTNGMWQGTLTADGATVHVQGNRGVTPSERKFRIANGGVIYFDGFNPGQEAVADEGYTIVNAGENLWQLVSEESIVAEELRNPDERFADLQWAADSVGSAKILVIKDNDKPIKATRDFFVQVANGVVWGGALINNGFKVTTMSGSTFGRNLGNDLTLNANQALANLNKPMNDYSNVWRVVTADKVVAQIEGYEPPEYFTDVATAADWATNRSTIAVLADVDTVVLSDTNIYKRLMFTGAEHLKGNPPIAAQRHNEYYEFKETALGVWEFMLKPTLTKKLSFIIEGAGRVLVNDKDPDHTETGSSAVPNYSYSELKPFDAIKLTAKPTENGGAAFWRWENEDGTRVYTDISAADINPYDDEITFVMPPDDVTLRLVFLPKENVFKTDVVLTADTACKLGSFEWPMKGVWLDTVRGTPEENGTKYTFKDIKSSDIRPSEHMISVVANDEGGFRFVCFVTNEVVATDNPVFSDFITETNATTEITARFVSTQFDATSDNPTKTYDRSPTNAVLTVENGDYLPEEAYIVWSEDAGETWQTNGFVRTLAFPSYTEANVYTNLWQIWDGKTPSALIQAGQSVVTIKPRNIVEDTGFMIKFADKYAVGIGVAPVIEAWYDWIEMINEAEFKVEYEGTDQYAEAKAIVTGVDNYCGTKEMPFAVLQAEDGTDAAGNKYYMNRIDKTAILFEAKSSGVEYDLPEKIAVDGTDYRVVEVAPGAFTNCPDLVRIRFQHPVKLTGNVIWGLEKLEYIDFWGSTPDDCEYYYYKMGLDNTGAGFLLKSNRDATPGVVDWEYDTVTLLGVADAADTFTVRPNVTRISETAFAGNPLLRRVILHRNIIDIESKISRYVDLDYVVFAIKDGPTPYLEKAFRAEGHPFYQDYANPDWYVTFDWTAAEALIRTAGGVEIGYGTFKNAYAAARDGETVVLLKNITNENVLVGQKTVNIDGGAFEMIGCEFLYTNGDGLRILSGTYDQDLRTKLTYPETDTMEKWFALDGSYPSNRWTVIRKSDIVCTMTSETDSVNYRTLSDAALDSKGGETLELIKQKGVQEDVTFTHSITFLGSIEGRRWKGLLTAADGAIVLVKGTRAAKDGNQKFAVANGGTVLMDYFAGQCAVADPANYSIVRVEPQLWQLLLENGVVAIDLDDPEDRYYGMQLAADNVVGRVLVIKDNDQSITATRNFVLATEHTADNIAVYDGALASGAFQVSTLIGSTFGRNLGNDLYFYPDQALANMNQPLNGYSNVWCVVTADKVVAQIEGRDPAEYFTTVVAAANTATDGETIIILNTVNDPVELSDGNIQKMLKFKDDDGNLKGGVKAERHDDFYEWKKTEMPKDSGIYVYELVLKDMPTHKLEFEIIGEGGVYVTNKPAHVVRLGYAYADLKPGEWYELKGVPEFNGKDAFWRWENADGTRLASWSNDCDQVNCAYDDVIRFQMLNEDMKLRAVFKKPEDCVRSTLTVYPDNWNRTIFPGEVMLDGKIQSNGDRGMWTFEGVKPGDHELLAIPHSENAQYEKFVCWIVDGQTNNVEGKVLYDGGRIVYDNPYMNFEFGTSNATIVARWTETNIWSAAENVRKTYDGVDTNITVKVDDERKLSLGYKIEYQRLDIDGAPWTEESPVFTDAGVYSVAWHVLSKGDEDSRKSYWRSELMAVVDEGIATVTIDPASLAAADSLVYVCLDRQYIILGEDNPKVIGRYLNFDLKEGVDFIVTYSDYEDIGTATAHVEGKGNYGDSIDLPYGVFQQVPSNEGGMVIEAADGNGYAGDLSGLGVVLTSVKSGSCTTAPDGKLEFAVPETITVNMTKPFKMSIQNVPVIGVAAGAFDNIPEVQRILFPVEVEIYGNIIRGLENLEYIDFWGMDQQSWDADYMYKKLGEEHGGAGILLKKPVTDEGPFGAGLPPQPYDLYGFNGWELIGVADAANVFSIAGGFDLDKHIDIDAIGADAFYGNTNLIEIALTNGVKWLQPGLIEQSNIDTNLMFFSMSEEPTEEIRNFFAGEGLSWTNEPDVANRWTTFNWGVYDARIINSAQEKRGYYTLVEAFDAATDGQTVEVMRDLDGEVGHSYTISGKAVVLDAKDRTLTNMKLFVDEVNGGELRILAGTFGKGVLPGAEADYQNLLQAGTPSAKGLHWFADPVFKKWYADAEDDGSVRYTVVEREDYDKLKVKLEKFENGEVIKTDWFGSLADANRAAVGDGTEKITILADEYSEDVVIDKEIELVFDANHLWKGTLTASGVKVTVTGVHELHLIPQQLQYFAVEGEGAAVLFNYYPGYYAPADYADGYRVAQFNASQWTLVLKDLIVARDTNPILGELYNAYIDMQVAADVSPSADITVVKTNDQPIVATRDFTIRVEDGQVWNGLLDANGYKVQATLGSTFGHDLIDELDWSNGLTLAYDGDEAGTWTVVRPGDIVAQVRNDMDKPTMKFASAQAAFDWLRAYVDANPGEAGSFYGIDIVRSQRWPGERAEDYVIDLGGETLNWPVFMEAVAALTVRGGTIAGDFTAVQGGQGQVIFEEGLRMPDAKTAFKAGDVNLIVRKGAYINDPTPYCEEGYTAARRSKDDLSGYYVVYPLAEVEVTIVDGTHPVHYRTFQDAIDLASADETTVQLFNDGMINATVWSDKKIVLTSDPNGAVQTGADLLTNSVIIVEGDLVVSNLNLEASEFIVRAGGLLKIYDTEMLKASRITVEDHGKFVAHDGFVMSGSTDGAVIVRDGGQFVLNGNAKIYDNNGKNVVIENAETGFLLKNRGTFGANLARVGITCTNNIAGTQFGTVDNYPFDLFAEGDNSGDNSNAPIFCDTDPTLRVGRGKTIVGPIHAETNSVRYINDYTAVLYEGKDLITRSGNELVWLDQQDAPPAVKPDYLGGTYGTVTLKVDWNCDYALVCEGSSTNWVSMNETTAPNEIYVFENLDPTTKYTVLKRKSITQDAMVSPFVEIPGEKYWTTKYTAADIPAWFDDSETHTSGTVGTKTEKAWNDVVEVTVAADGLGYFIKLIKDSNRGANIPTDAGVLTIDMNGLYLRTTTLADDNGIAFLDPDAPEFNYASPKADYDATFKTRLTVINGERDRGVSNITGSSSADESGAAGAAGIENATDHLVYVTLREGVQVCGGNGGSGANRTGSTAVAGGDGAAAITGEITLTVNGATLKGGNGAKGGDSTNGTGGDGGAGGPAIGAGVTGDIITGTLIGGNGGNGGNVAYGEKLGAGGNGGNCIVNRAAVTFDQGHQYDGTIVLIPGKGGQGDPAGLDGEAGKPAAPEAPTIKYLTGNSVTLNVKPGVQYTIFETAKGMAVRQVWTTAREEQYELTFKNLVKGTDYTVLARIPESRTEYESFYSQLDFTTPTYNKADFEKFFPGSIVTEKDGKYVVQLFEDIVGGIRLPDNLGEFTLKMNQFSIYGADGQWNLEDYRNGGPAITFTGSGDTDSATLTRMTVEGTGANKIVGGEGASPANEVADGEALDGGQGGNGLAVAKDGAPVRKVEVIWVKGELLGGNGGDGADTTNGDAGNGGNGGDAYDAENIDFTLNGGRAVGGNGGKGGDCYRGKAGNGGNGGDAEAGEGGMGGLGGKCLTDGEDGQDGQGGSGIIPGGVSEVYKAKVVDKNGNERFYTTFEAAAEAATYGSTIVIIRDCIYDGDDYSALFAAQDINDSQVADNAQAVVLADNVTLTSANGAVLTWNGTLAVDANVSNFVIAAELNVDPASKGSLYVAGDVTMNGGYVPNLFVANGGKAGLKGGVVWANGGCIGNLWVADDARFVAEVDSQVRVDGVIRAAGYDTVNGIYKDMFLFGGYYGANPAKFVRDPFMVADAKEVIDGKEYFHIVQDSKFAAMVWLDGRIWGVETIDAAFAAILNSSEKIRVDLLKDCDVTTVLDDQNRKIDAEIHGHGHVVTDKRTGAAAEQALFNISNNVRFHDIVFDGQGTEAGQFLRLFETSAVVLDGCTVTGYASRNEAKGSSVTLPLIFYSSAGEATVFVLRDTVITNNDVSAAISAIDTSGAGFTTHIGVAGSTTIEGSGVGILSDAKLQITAIDELTGGWIDVYYEGTGANKEFGRINIANRTFRADGDYLEATASHFRYVGGKLGDRSCGHVVTGADGLLYLAWTKDVRQYVAKITRADGSVDTYTTVEDAFADIDQGCTLTLLEDATVERMITAKLPKAGYRYTVDLNGKTLTNDGNLLKFGTGDMTIRNGTLASAPKYALYIYGADVALEDVTVDCDIYVAKGTLKIDDDDVKVKGVIAKTNNGSVSITRGIYTQKPAAYLTTLSEAYPINDTDPLYADGYRWYVTAAIEKPGFADGFDLPVAQDADGNYTIDVSGGDAVGKLREGAKVILPGDLTDRITIKGALGWKITAAYDETNGKTTVLFEMDREALKPVLGDTENEEHPFEVQTDGNGNVTYVALRMKNAIRGFYYQLKAADDLASGFKVVSEKYFDSLDTTDLEFTMKQPTEKFFYIDYSDRPTK